MTLQNARRALAAAALTILAGACAPVPSDLPVSAPPDDTVEVLPAAAEAPAVPQLRSGSIARVARQLTVRVRARGCGRLGTASAVAVGPRLLVTNRHVVGEAEELELNYWDGTSATAVMRWTIQ